MCGGRSDAGRHHLRLVSHDDNVGCLNGGVRTQPAHSDTDIGGGQNRRIIDAVAGIEDFPFPVSCPRSRSSSCSLSSGSSWPMAVSRPSSLPISSATCWLSPESITV